jgi:YbgC/YbaW family acyl-CoA thioester hydrolase
MFTERLRVRAYECDSLGHVNNSVYLYYLQQATLDAHGWLDEPIVLPTPRALSIEYARPARYGDELELATWLTATSEQSFTHAYTIRRVTDDAVILHARIEWGAAPAAESTEVELHPLALKPFREAIDNGARPWLWRHAVRRYEVDPSQTANLAAYFQWIEEATFRAAHEAGWTIERFHAENFIVFQYRHDATFFEPARNRDQIEIASRLVEIKKIRATWIHDLYRVSDHMLLLRDYSTGAFLDEAGNLHAAPVGMMEQLTEGEPQPD